MSKLSTSQQQFNKRNPGFSSQLSGVQLTVGACDLSIIFAGSSKPRDYSPGLIRLNSNTRNFIDLIALIPTKLRIGSLLHKLVDSV
jgi:hypothetical protein